MHDERSADSPCPSPEAFRVFGLLERRGGTLRPAPLLEAAHLEPRVLVDAINELAERGWVKIAWRNPRLALADGVPECFRAVERITATRFGRWRYSVTWPAW